LGNNQLKSFIRDVPDFPKKGIVFKDITPLLKDPRAFREAVDALTEHYRRQAVSLVVAAEARGFILGPTVAYNLGAGFVPVRKPGKLPYLRKKATYQTEYSTDSLEIHEDALGPGARVLIVDDLLATGVTIKAVSELVKAQKATIAGVAFLVELKFLRGKEKLKDLPVYSVIKY